MTQQSAAMLENQNKTYNSTEKETKSHVFSAKKDEADQSEIMVTKEELLMQCAEVQERTRKMIAEKFRQSRYITENVSFKFV